jgi:polyribonucleotide nucleotidyltransferase
VHHSRKRASIQGQDFRLNDVVTGVVQNIASYGAFVDMDGAVGLLHISQITHERISSVDQVLKVGRWGTPGQSMPSDQVRLQQRHKYTGVCTLAC